MRPFVLVEVEDNAVQATKIIGVEDMVSIVVDWDTVDSDEATELLNEIRDRHRISPGQFDKVDDSVLEVIDRLEGIKEEAEDEDEDFEDEDEFEGDIEDEDEGDDEDDYLL